MSVVSTWCLLSVFQFVAKITDLLLNHMIARLLGDHVLDQFLLSVLWNLFVDLLKRTNIASVDSLQKVGFEDDR